VICLAEDTTARTRGSTAIILSVGSRAHSARVSTAVAVTRVEGLGCTGGGIDCAKHLPDLQVGVSLRVEGRMLKATLSFLDLPSGLAIGEATGLLGLLPSGPGAAFGVGGGRWRARADTTTPGLVVVEAGEVSGWPQRRVAPAMRGGNGARAVTTAPGPVGGGAGAGVVNAHSGGPLGPSGPRRGEGAPAAWHRGEGGEVSEEPDLDLGIHAAENVVSPLKLTGGAS
jgi:hypothetical protein